MRKKRIAFVLILIFTAGAALAHTGSLYQRRIRFNAGGGFGLPKIPFSEYRAPISFLLNGGLPVKVLSSFWVQGTAGALTTVNLGSINDEKKEMRFNLLWTGIEGMYRFRYDFRNEGFLSAGLGYYHLSQLFDDQEDKLETPGFSLALISWTHREQKWDTSFQLRWHLLFEPDENPQVATVTLGFLF